MPGIKQNGGWEQALRTILWDMKYSMWKLREGATKISILTAQFDN